MFWVHQALLLSSTLFFGIYPQLANWNCSHFCLRAFCFLVFEFCLNYLSLECTSLTHLPFLFVDSLTFRCISDSFKKPTQYGLFPLGTPRTLCLLSFLITYTFWVVYFCVLASLQIINSSCHLIILISLTLKGIVIYTSRILRAVSPNRNVFSYVKVWKREFWVAFQSGLDWRHILLYIHILVIGVQNYGFHNFPGSLKYSLQ
jgi:hypothetical protein